jgi:hypothetical protein
MGHHVTGSGSQIRAHKFINIGPDSDLMEKNELHCYVT